MLAGMKRARKRGAYEIIGQAIKRKMEYDTKGIR